MILKKICNYKKTQLKKFNCGFDELNLFLKRFAKKNDKLGYGKTFILEENDDIIGFFTLSVGQIEYNNLPEEYNVPKYPCPVVRISRLAVDINYQKRGYGHILMSKIFSKIILVSNEIGIFAVVVDSKKEASLFYEQYNFIRLFKYKYTYFLPINDIKL